MSERKTTQPPSSALAAANPHGMALIAQPERMASIWKAASALAATTAVPMHFRHKPGEVFGAMLLLDGLGAHPVTALRLCYEIKGNLGVQSKLKIATANARGAFKGPVTFETTGQSGGLLPRAQDENAVIPGDLAVTAHATLHTGEVVEQRVTLADAVGMGWTKRGRKGGPNARWEVPAMQVRMLQWRAADWLIEQYAPETTSGVRTAEELYDLDAAGQLEPRDVALEPGESDDFDDLNRELQGKTAAEPEPEPEAPKDPEPGADAFEGWADEQ